MSSKPYRQRPPRIAEREASSRAPGSQRQGRSALEKLADTPALAIAITLAVYLRCVGNAFVYDDNEMIVLNRFIGDWALAWKSFVHDSWWFRNPLSLPQSAYYRPLQDVWLAANFHLFGFEPAGWHLAIVAVHLTAVWLVFAIARELTDTRWTPLIAATLFGVLPIHAQAVVWPTAIPLPMSATFELAAFLCFIRRERDARARTILAPLFYALALLSHESAVMFPLLIATYASILERDSNPANLVSPDTRRTREWVGRAAIATIPFLIELAVYLAIRWWVLGFISRLNLTNHMTGAQQWLTTPAVLGTYVVLLIAPWRAGPAHPIEMVSALTSRECYLPALALVGLITTAILTLWNDRRRRLYLFCAIWIAVTIAPMLNLRAFSPLAMVEDRYLYLASVAWCIALAELLVSICSGVRPPGWSLAISTVALVAMYAGMLFHVEGFWHDEVALFSTCAEMSPRSNLCHDRLGLALKQRGDLAGAERQFLIAQEIDPQEGANLYNLGLLHARMGRNPEAVDELKSALARLPGAPPAAFIELARIADLAGDANERDAAIGQAAKLPGGGAAAAQGRAELLMMHRDFAGAEAILRSALARSPDEPDEWTLLGNALARQGRTVEALEAYQKSLNLKPDAELRRMVASMLQRQGVDRSKPH